MIGLTRNENNDCQNNSCQNDLKNGSRRNVVSWGNREYDADEFRLLLLEDFPVSKEEDCNGAG